MSLYETDSYESTDFPAELINEAARLESELKNQEISEEESSKEAEVLDVLASKSSEETSEKNSKPILRDDVSNDEVKTNSDLKLASSIKANVPKVGGSTLAKKSTECKTTLKNSSFSREKTSHLQELSKPKIKIDRKRSYAHISSDSVLLHPPEPKSFNSNFKIPKKSKKNSSQSLPKPFTTELTEEQKVFLQELEKDFADRYTDLDEDYKNVTRIILTPPVVENYQVFSRRSFHEQDQGSSYNDKNNRKPYSYYRQNHSRYSGDYARDRHHYKPRYQPY